MNWVASNNGVPRSPFDTGPSASLRSESILNVICAKIVPKNPDTVSLSASVNTKRFNLFTFFCLQVCLASLCQALPEQTSSQLMQALAGNDYATISALCSIVNGCFVALFKLFFFFCVFAAGWQCSSGHFACLIEQNSTQFVDHSDCQSAAQRR